MNRSTGPSITAKGGPFAWRGTDFVTAAVLGVAMGVAFIGWDYLLNTPWTLLTAGFPPAGSLALGVWLLPAVAAGLLIRRPGAALFVEMIAALLEYWLGNPWGPGVLISGLLQGLGVELALAALRWRRFGLGVAMLAGAASAVLEIVAYEWWSYAAEYSWTWKLAVLGCSVLSGIVIAGVGGWALVRALAATGVINNFPPGQEYLAAHLDEDDLAPDDRADSARTR